MKLKLKVKDYNLDLTFKPSFISSIYTSNEQHEWSKIAGHLAFKIKFKQVNNDALIVESESGLTLEALHRRVLLETGLYKGPYENYIQGLPSKVKPQIEALAEVYKGVRLPYAPLDFKYILVAAALSKRVNYERVVDWCRKIWMKVNGRLDLIANFNKRDLKSIGDSYQVFQLQKTMKSFEELSKRLHEKVKELIGEPYVPPEEFILWLPPELARLTLINGCWGLGPKVTDSIILTTFKSTNVIPCDAHMKNVSIRLDLVKQAEMPEKRFCSKFICDSKDALKFNLPLCPKAERKTCLRVKLSYFKDLGGWIQSLIYLHGRKFCKVNKPLCWVCPIKKECNWE
jgi:endonuclease III